MTLVGRGVDQGELSTRQIRELSAQALASLPLAGKRVLVIIPDYSRHAPLELFFRIIFDLIGE
ncbi:MAG: hypothetical protein ACETWG_06355 [Candidatus Neomarinimicrobiota bacterium]